MPSDKQILNYIARNQTSTISCPKLQDMETYEVRQQFQQPSGILHDAYGSKIDLKAAEDRSSYQYFDGPEENNARTNESEEENMYTNDDEEDDSLQILEGFLKELDVKGHEVFKKLVSRFEKDVPIERVVREKLHDFKGKHGSDMLEKFARKLNGGGEEGIVSRERDVDGAIWQEEFEHRLERFKVKTVNVKGSGVKEEGK